MTPEERDFKEYGFSPDIMGNNGFAIGDQVLVIDERENADDTGIYEGEEGSVVGFAIIPPAKDPAMAMAFGNDPNGRTAMYVLMDGTDEPIEIPYEQLEVQ